MSAKYLLFFFFVFLNIVTSKSYKTFFGLKCDSEPHSALQRLEEWNYAIKIILAIGVQADREITSSKPCCVHNCLTNMRPSDVFNKQPLPWLILPQKGYNRILAMDIEVSTNLINLKLRFCVTHICSANDNVLVILYEKLPSTPILTVSKIHKKRTRKLTMN